MGFLQRRILRGVIAVVSYPKLTLAIAALLLLASLGLAWSRLTISTDQNKLFSSNVSFFRDYLDFVRKFPENDALYVLIEPRDPRHPPETRRWAVVADALDARLRKVSPDYVTSVETRVRPSDLGPYGLLFEDPSRLESNLAEFRQFAQLLKTIAERPGLDRVILGNTPTERFFGAMANAATFDPKQFDRSGPMAALMADSLRDAVQYPAEPIGDLMPDFSRLDAETPARLGYSYLPDASDPTHRNHILLITVHYVQRFDSLTAISETVETIRTAVNEAAAPFQHEFHVGVTGRPALEADEMRTTDRDSHRSEIVALSCVFIGIALMLRSLWLAFVAEISLAVGIGWTFGWATLSVGQLNLLSIVFVIALIGIGMDYLVQILTRYRREARRYVRQKAIWARVFRYVSPPIFTACCGAAGAFLVSLLTDFRGAAELGIIAGGGLLLCLLAGYTVLPALLVLFPAKLKQVSVHRRYTDDKAPPRHGWWRLVSPVLWLCLLLIGGFWAFRVRFNPNLLELQAPQLESVKLVRKLQTWSAVELSPDLDLLRRVRDALKQAPSVYTTDSILNAYDNAAWLKAHADQVPQIQWAAPEPLKSADLPRLSGVLATLVQRYRAAGQPDAAASVDAFRQILLTPRRDDDALLARLNLWQQALIPHLQAMAAQFSPPPLDLSKLPSQLKNHYRSLDGVYALYILPRPEMDLWKHEPLKQFVTEVEAAIAQLPGAPAPTGIAMDIFHSTSSIERSFYHSAFYALALIVLLVWLDLRRISQTLLAISVLALGLPMLIILMGILDVSWNFANFFGLPILIGAGHEYGVFMVHRYREVLHNPRRVWRAWDVSDRALLLCAFITSTSFGFFWLIGHHEGLRSLGWVMMVGTACIYLATIFVVRPLLVWRLGDKGVYTRADEDDE